MAYTTRGIGSAADYHFDNQRDAYADRLAQRPTSAPAKLTATIQRGFYGTWFVERTGRGYPHTERLTSPLQAERRLSQLVEDGYRVEDPEGYCDIYGVLSDDAVSSRELDADAAESPAVAMVGSIPGDNGRGVVVVELDF